VYRSDSPRSSKAVRPATYTQWIYHDKGKDRHKWEEVQLRSPSTSLIYRGIEVHGHVASNQDLSVPTGRTPAHHRSNWFWTKQDMGRCHHQAILKDHFGKSIRWRSFNWLFQNQLKTLRLHPFSAPSVHPTDSWNFKTECWIIKHKIKTFEWIISKSTQSSRATPIGCTLGAPNGLTKL
jgi:hypothetical protein